MASESFAREEGRGPLAAADEFAERAIALGGAVAVRVDDERRVERDAGVAQGRRIAVVFLAVAERARRIEEGDGTMAEPDQMLDRLVGAAAIVDADDVEAGVGIGDEEDDRIARFAQRPDALELAMGGRIDEDAVDLARAEDVERGDLLVEDVVARREHQTVAARRQLALDRAGGERQRRVHDVGEDQADGLGLAADQRLGDLIGEIVQLSRRGEDEIAGLLRDAPALAQRQRHRIRREAGGERDILEAGMTSRPSCCDVPVSPLGNAKRLAMQAAAKPLPRRAGPPPAAID